MIYQMMIGFGICNEYPTRITPFAAKWNQKTGRYDPEDLIEQVNHRDQFVKYLKQSSDLFTFVLTKELVPLWDKLLEKYPTFAQENVLFEMPYFVTNGAHQTEVEVGRRRLKLIILKGSKYHGEEPNVRV